MQSFILFLAIVGHGNGGVTSAEFDSRMACEEARSTAVIEFGRQSTAVISFCVPKGSRTELSKN